MAPSIDDLGGAKPGDRLVVTAEGAIAINSRHRTLLDRMSGNANRLTEGQQITVLDKERKFSAWTRSTLIRTPFLQGSALIGNNENLFAGKAPEQESPSRRER